MRKDAFTQMSSGASGGPRKVEGQVKTVGGRIHLTGTSFNVLGRDDGTRTRGTNGRVGNVLGSVTGMEADAASVQDDWMPVSFPLYQRWLCHVQ